MTTAHMLPAGIYSLVPCDTYDDGSRMISLCLDPVAAIDDEHPEDGQGYLIEVPTPAEVITTLEGHAGHLILKVDLGDVEVEGSSIQSPLGPLSIAAHYLLMPAASLTRNPQPDEQYAQNWVSFELTAEQPLSVDGSIIRIGAMEVDAAALGDVAHTVYGDRRAGTADQIFVARTGTPLHAILAEMSRELDDGVLILLTFRADQVERIEWIGTPEADAFAADMRGQIANGRNHGVYRPALS